MGEGKTKVELYLENNKRAKDNLRTLIYAGNSKSGFSGFEPA